MQTLNPKVLGVWLKKAVWGTLGAAFGRWHVAVTIQRRMRKVLPTPLLATIDIHFENAIKLHSTTTSNLHTTPYTLHPSPFTLHLTPYTLHPIPHTEKGAGESCASVDEPPTLNPEPETLNPKLETRLCVGGRGGWGKRRSRSGSAQLPHKSDAQQLWARS
jgi:hypothetical protein